MVYTGYKIISRKSFWVMISISHNLFIWIITVLGTSFDNTIFLIFFSTLVFNFYFTCQVW